jgi:hypothetical protein
MARRPIQRLAGLDLLAGFLASRLCFQLRHHPNPSATVAITLARLYVDLKTYLPYTLQAGARA